VSADAERRARRLGFRPASTSIEFPRALRIAAVKG